MVYLFGRTLDFAANGNGLQEVSEAQASGIHCSVHCRNRPTQGRRLFGSR